MENRNKPAYPFQGNPGAPHLLEGLSKREMISAMCLQGLLANPNLLTGAYAAKEDLSEAAVVWADALLTQLEKQ